MYLFIIFLIYFITSPHTIQYGDVSELVANSYKLLVSHPPGYPLMHLIFKPFLNIVDQQHVFRMASGVNVLIAMLNLLIIQKIINIKDSCLKISIISNIAFISIFWKYAIFPDVFMLNIFFAIIILYYFYNSLKIKNNFLLIIIGLSSSHHQTIVFLYPVFLYLRLKNEITNRVLIKIIAIGVLGLTVYLSLFFFHPESPESWGNISSFKNLKDHFLRKEYGTFKLIADNKNYDLIHSLKSFIYFFGESLFPILIITIFNLFKKNEFSITDKDKFIGGLILVYILVFFTLSGSGKGIFYNMIIERFYLFPIILSYIILVRVNNWSKQRNIKLLILLVSILLSLNLNYEKNNYSNNTIIQDYFIKNLKSLPLNSTLYVTGDTDTFGYRYIQIILNIRPDITIYNPHSFNSDYRKKISGLISSQDSLVKEFKYLIDNNKLFTNNPNLFFKFGTGAIYLNAFAQITNNKQLVFKCSEKDYIKYETRKLTYSFSILYLLNQFDCDFLWGLSELREKRYLEASKIFEKIIRYAPYHLKVLERLCYTYSFIDQIKKVKCDQSFFNISKEMKTDVWFELIGKVEN